jgi:hypothetical protein
VADASARLSVFCLCLVPLHAANDPHLEDEVAKAFIQIRAEARLPKLTRIKNREELQQLTCTAASRDAPVKYGPLTYKTDDPSTFTSELRKEALYKDPHGEVSVARFAVAVWPAQKTSSGQQEYWVGIRLYMSPVWELLEYTMTDDIGHRNDWKHLVSADCKNIH